MKTLPTIKAVTVLSTMAMLASVALADPSAERATRQQKEVEREKLVFITGSNIPQRIKVEAIGTNTQSPMRVYTRAEIDKLGRFTTERILAQDASIQSLGVNGNIAPGSH